MEAFFFWIFALGLVGGAVSVILNRNPVACALSLVSTFVFLAALFVTLEAFFLAMVQVIVYAGAVMVLFLFIIMLLDLKAEEARPFPWGKVSMVAVLSLVFATFFHRVLDSLPAGGIILKWGTAGGIADARHVGLLLFEKYLLPFEATAVLLLVATLGVVILSMRGSK
ncbi:MAG: NADH-quinone oxidoreductase subunit J [Candidatus Methylacidiphilales bacterium]|nr:NADH-quinone oxidoreductase subunit J [Candidatus Methylacidiphilales bacterium]